MSAPVISRADLLRVLLQADPGAADAAVSLLGFERRPKEPKTAAPRIGPVDQGDQPTVTVIESGPRRPVPFWQPQHFELRPEEQPTAVVPAIKPVWRNRPTRPPEFQPLCRWRELAPRLRHAITLPQHGGKIDVDEVVDIWSRGADLVRLPRERRRQWPSRITVILDRAQRLWPYAHDQALVAGALEALVPPGQLVGGVCLPGTQWPILADSGQQPASWRQPDPGSVVLVLGDLGCLALHEADATRPWLRLGEEIRAAGSVPVALFPGALSRCSPSVRRIWRVVPWERGTERGSPDTQAAAETLIGLLSRAVRIEPGLLRAVRRAVLPWADAGVESEVWQHPAIETAYPEAAALAPQKASGLHVHLSVASDGDRETVLRLWREWRHGVRDVVWFEEFLNLPNNLQLHVPHAAEDREDSEAYMIWRVADNRGTDIAAREYLHRAARRAGEVGWATPALAKALLAAKALDDPDFKPPYPVDPQWAQGTPATIDFWQCGNSVVAMPAGVALGTAGSLLGTLLAGNGRWTLIEDADGSPDAAGFWIGGTAPSWAHNWGTDAYGPWVTFRVPDRRGGWVVQRMRWCPQGRFMMGSPEDENGRFDAEGPQHAVTFAQGFWMFDTACTEQLWRAVLNRPTQSRKTGLFPITHVSWQDAQDFIAALNAMLPGLALSLPSEAQWEYACRADSTTAYSFGDTIRPSQVINFGTSGTVLAGSLPANAWGLHEMHGNVWEWCTDHWHGNYEAAPADGSAWIDDKQAAAARVLRGGSWLSEARNVRSAYRHANGPANRNDDFGFRCARVQAASGAEQVAVPVDPASRPGAERGRPQGPTRAATLLRVGESVPCPAPRSGAMLIRSDREELRFRSFEKPVWASAIGRDRFGLFTEFTVSGTEVSQRMRWVPPGRFGMGSPDNEPGRYPDEGPVHRVTIAEGYWLFDTPCTQALWQAVMSDNPSRFQSPTRPVEQVSYDDVLGFLAEMNDRLPDLALSLPSEAQWEYACRAGTQTSTYAGPMEILGANNAPILDAIAWYGGNSGKNFDLASGYDSAGWPEKQYDHAQAGSQPVALKAPNPWGLYDMLGNVWEWCADEWHDTYDGAPTGGSAWIDDNNAAANRVLRGGSWSFEARDVRSAFRGAFVPALRRGDIGFRCARVQSASVAIAGAQGGEEQAQRAERVAATTSPKWTGAIRVPKLRPQRK